MKTSESDGQLDLADLFLRRDDLCAVYDQCYRVSEFLLDHSPLWLDEI